MIWEIQTQRFSLPSSLGPELSRFWGNRTSVSHQSPSFFCQPIIFLLLLLPGFWCCHYWLCGCNMMLGIFSTQCGSKDSVRPVGLGLSLGFLGDTNPCMPAYYTFFLPLFTMFPITCWLKLTTFLLNSLWDPLGRQISLGVFTLLTMCLYEVCAVCKLTISVPCLAPPFPTVTVLWRSSSGPPSLTIDLHPSSTSSLLPPTSPPLFLHTGLFSSIRGEKQWPSLVYYRIIII